MLSQFTPEGGHKTLKDLSFPFPKDAYPLGRLDADSEGILILTNDSTLNKVTLNTDNHVLKQYYIQIDGSINQEAIEKLSKGVVIKLPNGQPYKTKACQVSLIPEPVLPNRNPPIRVRKNIPTSWIQITLQEGKNRQIRKMTTQVGFPTLRIVRISFGKVNLFNLPDLIEKQVLEIRKGDIL